MAEINGTSSSTQERADERYTFVSRRYIAIATNRAIIVKDYVKGWNHPDCHWRLDAETLTQRTALADQELHNIITFARVS